MSELKQSLLDFTQKELEALIKPSFRAKQIYGWLYHQYAETYDDMKNIPKALKEELAKKYLVNPMKIVKKELSSDGTIKYLFELQDGKTVEAVWLKMKDTQLDDNGEVIQEAKYTICVSTQVGCKVGCSFCLTAKGGFTRDLTAGEIVAQVVNLKRDNDHKHNRKINIVYMGMGEPLDNLSNLAKAIEIFKEEEGLCISGKRQTVSTSGLSNKIDKLGEMDLGVHIAISLHAVDDELRTELIPMNKAHNIASIIEAVKRFPIDTRKRVMFEYLVIKNKNDDIGSAKKLVKLLTDIKAKVNLIYFNPYPGTSYERPSKSDMIAFQDYLVHHGLLCTIRDSKGIDISAACGQLKEKTEGER
ncbi:MAG: 23S rRNA (adenine(2503)-C(2))-methyltransferase RlmN [Epsilonproteobacteria bacterium]|nr:23S rRNA (adenine(2503)-C(2))-methyltransferase RlmN [Campylobacterota bacterium]OIO17961.1 MAG: 23S rRNA (adenine(2503)-C(2))-methyltransferase RlmN [Helicobacteraceae bacterium CG1_02_36_14]PIP09969.1 MAG: 23S rRNA (adenine(2503)-C(2))-methyltransferase RlmN [Sulfurimonas sp. CG23_combo_of_CG06-09_8_20_14_all_36_33]PIS25208.1 MAG: 23S rRNA (adenine(2503)-C(2))-methyltransferase RlmN [Sulfurimonas sp. CG08_land_8_20_14_0_20_36_33]PIU35342.1 MAG: 23S rRNA (adenine(2503)-C(2))-methyltransfera